jgi:nucleosome binding factor SPN SPT16 subunit
VKKLNTYSLLLADTVLVTDSSPDVLTKHSKGLEDITYLMNSSDPNEDEDEEDDDDEDEDEEEPEDDEALARKLSRKENANRNASGVRASARLASNHTAAQDATIAEREKRQIELMNRRNEERVREMARAARKGGSKDELAKAEELETYRGTRDFPDNVLPNQVKVDMVNKCVILPIGGNPVPFHISTIKNVVLPDPDAAHYLRINFYSAGVSIGKDTPKNMAKLIEKYAPYTSFIREMTFRSLDSQNLTDAFRKISELRKRERMKEVQDQEEADLVQQEQLIRTKNDRVPRLSDLTMRPSFAKQKTQGNLEAHSNGLRFQSNRGEVVDIIYSNIKHAFFQDCKQEIMVLIHFHLKNPIMVGKKKQDNIQFFTEVIEASQAIDDSRRRMNDPDELDDEQRERQLRRKLNDAFKDFSMKVESVAKKNGFNLEFDVPYRDLGFQGTPNKEMVFIMPTLNCLVNLTENPFFVVDLSEVDHVHFERVTFSSKAFDMILVNKDFNKMPARIDMIPNADKESIQDWLTDMEITYTEGPMNLNWKTLMETIKGEDRFYHDTEEDEITEKEAGWSFLRMQGNDDSSEAETVEDDSDFDEEEDEEESEEEEEESDYDEEDEEESDYDADEDLEEQGMDWDEMERKAINEDRKRGRNEEQVSDGRDRSRRSRR